MVQMPPLQLSSGPAISGGPNESGPAFTGDFYIDRRDTWQDKAMLVLPVIALGGVLWLMSRKR